jgi:hypothetical protein
MSSTIDIDQTWETLNYNGGLQWFWKGPSYRSGGRVISLQAAHRLVESATLAGANLYVTLNPTTPCGVKARASDVTIWRYLLIDVDPTGKEIA